jgi:hypothetical protein
MARMRYLGVDVTGTNRAWDWILIDDDAPIPRHVRGDERELLEFVKQTEPNVIAVDAPSKKNCGLMRQQTVRRDILGARATDPAAARCADDCRVAEAELAPATSSATSLRNAHAARLRARACCMPASPIRYMLWDTLTGLDDRLGHQSHRDRGLSAACFVVKLG